MDNGAHTRIAQPEDAEVIRNLSYRIWPRVYADMISSAQMEYMLNWMYATDTLRKQMEHEGVTYLLLEKNEPIGFAGFGPSTNQRYKLHKLYVDPDHHGQGYGQLLMERLVTLLPKDCKGIELQVNKSNPARHFYNKIGFEIESEAVFDIGQGYVMDDYIMFKSLDTTAEL